MARRARTAAEPPKARRKVGQTRATIGERRILQAARGIDKNNVDAVETGLTHRVSPRHREGRGGITEFGLQSRIKRP
jgi:hypothetical protein